MLFRLLFGMDRPSTYTVHERPDAPADRMDRAEALSFIKDGFTFPAFLAPPLWFASKRLWLALLLYTGAAAAIVATVWLFGLPTYAGLLAILGLHLLFGSEADDLERAERERQGWASLGSVSGIGVLDCQRRFLDVWLPAQPVLRGPRGEPLPQSAAILPAASPPRAVGGLAALLRRKS